MARNCYDNMTARLCESTIKRGTWKVWVTGLPGGKGWLRLGFAWKTKGGAERATTKMFPGINFVA